MQNIMIFNICLLKSNAIPKSMFLMQNFCVQFSARNHTQIHTDTHTYTYLAYKQTHTNRCQVQLSCQNCTERKTRKTFKTTFDWPLKADPKLPNTHTRLLDTCGKGKEERSEVELASWWWWWCWCWWGCSWWQWRFDRRRHDCVTLHTKYTKRTIAK